MIMKTTQEFQAVTHAREFSEAMYPGSGDSYAEHIRESLEKRIERGDLTREEAMTYSLGLLYVGNEGE
jgi:hypothetical protein